MSAVRTRKKYLKLRDGEIIHERRGEMGRSSAYIHTGQAISLLFPRIKNRKCLRLSRRSFRIRGAERRFVAVIAAGMNAGRAQFGNVGTNTTRDGNGDDVGVAFLLLLRRHRKRRLAVGTVPAGLWTDGRTDGRTDNSCDACEQGASDSVGVKVLEMEFIESAEWRGERERGEGGR